ncbi:adenylate kinase [Vagococcus fluvialis]|uniref:adenylate kinase n=1 Tax=Vagococcus fluvialis TaxID=2738 RepID=UPI0037D4FA69
MIILIAGTSHTGKTNLAQKLLEKYHYPYMSIDHLKMGLIRSKQTILTPEDDDLLTPYLWNITSEIIKTAIENKQNLIVEGCYIPFNWKKDFSDNYLNQIKYICLIMSEEYILNNYAQIKNWASVIEDRGNSDSDLLIDSLIKDNLENLENCKKMNLDYFLINDSYDVNIELD